MEKNEVKFEAIKGGILIVIGVIALIMSSAVGIYTGHENDNAYGGDAYTGIQNAAAQTANNVAAVGNGLEEIFCYSMVFTGLAFIGCGLIPIAKILVYKGKLDKKPAPSITINDL